MPPKLIGVLETCLYVADTELSQRWYEKIFGLSLVASDGKRLRAMQVKEAQLLLLFKKGGSPDHDGQGQNHLAFATSVADLPVWERWLAEHGIAIEERKQWQFGGQSIYFRDPDGHLLELATPGIWPVF